MGWESSTRFELRDLYRIPIWVLSKPFYWFAPPSLFFRLASFRGTLESWFLPIHDEILDVIQRHLGAERSNDELRLIARRHLQARRKAAFAKTWPQIRRFPGADAISVDGIEYLDQALARKNGAILLSGHFGYPRLIKPILRSRGRDALLVGLDPSKFGPQQFPPKLTRLGRFVHDRVLRLPSGSDGRWMATVGPDLVAGLNVRPHLAALARNEVLIMLVDTQAGLALKQTSILGFDMTLSSGPLRLAQKSGAAALPTFVVDDPQRRGPFGLRLIIGPPLDLEVSGDPRADLEIGLERYATAYTEVVRKYAHDWNWAQMRYWNWAMKKWNQRIFGDLGDVRIDGSRAKWMMKHAMKHEAWWADRR